MYQLFIFEEGIELGTETVAETDLLTTREYFERLGYQVEVEALYEAA